MPKLRHLAVHTPDLEKTAEFYKRAFELAEVARSDSPYAWGIHLSDGDLNVAILQYKSPEAADRGDGLGPVFGLHHVGFWVEDVEAARRRLHEAGARPQSEMEATAGVSFEEKWIGPDGVMLDISGHGWQGARPPSEA